jgi:hypothetical protein
MPLVLSADDFENSLAAVRAAAAGPVEGIFGPESLTWRVDREAAVLLGAGRALLDISPISLRSSGLRLLRLLEGHAVVVIRR